MPHQISKASRFQPISRRLKVHPAASPARNLTPETRQSETQPENEKKKPVRINYIVRDLPLY
jgi:hypothetical protein